MPNVNVFDDKNYNPQAFGKYINSIPKVRKNELIKANIFTSDKNIKDLFSSQSTAVYAVQPLIGDFNAKVQNLDGVTDIDGGGLDTYYYGITSYSRSVTGKEKDYTKNIIPGLKPLDQIAKKFSEKWDDVDEDTLIAIVNGLFSATGNGMDEFVESHTLEVNKVDETAIYDSTQKACGDQNQKFSLAIMHSKIANELAKKQLLEYIKYTDEKGIQRNTNIAQWGDKTVLVDDSITTMVINATYKLTSDTALNDAKTYYTKDNANVYTKVTSPNVSNISTYYEIDTAETKKYVTYVLGMALFDREDLPVEEPFERYRNALKNGGTTYLISREMKVVHPMGFSYLKKSQALESPTDEEFADGSNWGLAVSSSVDNPKYYPHKMIPLARIISTEV